MTPDELRAGPVAALIRNQRLIVVLRRIEPSDRLLALVDELADAGARLFEVTLDTGGAADALRACSDRLTKRCDGPHLVGAGTVRRPEQLRAAQQAGAAFAVSPTLNPDLVRIAITGGLPFVPGAATPTEVEQAWAFGATFVKLFPASSLGRPFIRELRGPLPKVETIATGGIDASNAREFLDAGAVAVGIGTGLVSAEADQRRMLITSVRDTGG
jgi:2-dehydro-3-deoxyphosphogluconate aldolase/(4S)-4-hydroxy-2-oxoglutarate aldolase